MDIPVLIAAVILAVIAVTEVICLLCCPKVKAVPLTVIVRSDDPQLEEKLRKVKQLEQIKQELAKEQAFSHKQLEEKLATSAQLEKVQKEAAKQVSELEINNEDITKKLKETEHRLKKEYENIQKQLENEKQKNIQLNNKNKEIQSNLQNIKKKAETASRELNNVKTGWSFRTGRIITFVPRKIRDWLK